MNEELIESAEDSQDESGTERESSEGLETSKTLETSETEERSVDYTEILSEMSGRLENIESALSTTPEPETPFFERAVDDLSAVETLLFIAVLTVIATALIDKLGGVLDSCMKH